jgi:hypothetical protein
MWKMIDGYQMLQTASVSHKLKFSTETFSVMSKAGMITTSLKYVKL